MVWPHVAVPIFALLGFALTIWQDVGLHPLEGTGICRRGQLVALPEINDEAVHVDVPQGILAVEVREKDVSARRVPTKQ